MGVTMQKDKLKEILNIDVIDLEGSINTKGNYIYLSGGDPFGVIGVKYEFTLILADNNLTNSGECLEDLIDTVFDNVAEYRLNNNIDIEFGKFGIKKKDDLFMYEMKIYISDLIK
jgi:hypothetical protein